MRQPFDTGLELHERTELGDARDTALAHLPHLVGRLHRRPRVGRELLQSQGDPVAVDPQHLDGQLLARRGDLRGVRDARPPHLGHVEQPLDPAAKVDERAKVADRDDAAGQHGIDHDGAPYLFRQRLLLLLEQRPPRDDELPSALVVLEDPERVDAPDVRRRVGVADRVDL